MANIISINSYALGLKNIDKTKLKLVGGKGANLGELTRIEGIHVPEGFCISTEAYNRIIGETLLINPACMSQTGRELLHQLSLLKVEDRDKISELSGEIRRVIEGIAIPQDIHEEITRLLSRFGENNAYAIRSSATAEDLPTASFAGQQDTYLNVIGKEAILQHISKCCSSLFTERSIIYRLQNGFDHRKVYLSVVVQKMVFPQAAGILFTADPVTSNRKVVSIDAGFGLGEALVSGLVNADSYKVRNGKIIDKKISTKKLAIYALEDGGTKVQEIEPELQNSQVLTDEQILQLEHIGRKIEKHFGCPQDIEWCLVDDAFYIVQSRPITTLYPIPEADDQENHVYVSVGHQQMMTDAMKPLGISFWQMTTPAPMTEVGGRLFVDVTQRLAAPAARAGLLEALGRSDPLTGDALRTVVESSDFIPSIPDDGHGGPQPGGAPAPIATDPAIVAELIGRSEASIAAVKRAVRTLSGSALLDFILADIQELQRLLLDPRSHQVYMGAMDASGWLNEKLQEWLGEKNAADTLTQSVPHNVTSEMGLALLDVADAIRPHPAVVAFLQDVEEQEEEEEEDFLDDLAERAGGREA